jgi:hypothetical protein
MVALPLVLKQNIMVVGAEGLIHLIADRKERDRQTERNGQGMRYPLQLGPTCYSFQTS